MSRPGGPRRFAVLNPVSCSDPDQPEPDDLGVEPRRAAGRSWRPRPGRRGRAPGRRGARAARSARAACAATSRRQQRHIVDTAVMSLVTGPAQQEPGGEFSGGPHRRRPARRQQSQQATIHSVAGRLDHHPAVLAQARTGRTRGRRATAARASPAIGVPAARRAARSARRARRRPSEAEDQLEERAREPNNRITSPFDDVRARSGAGRTARRTGWGSAPCATRRRPRRR